MTNNKDVYVFGKESDLNKKLEFLELSDLTALIDEYFGKLEDNTVLLSTETDVDNDDLYLSATRLADWNELELPYSFDDLLEVQDLQKEALNNYYSYGSEIYEEDFIVESVYPDNYPSGDPVFGDAVAGYLGAEVDQSVIDRFVFYANY